MEPQHHPVEAVSSDLPWDALIERHRKPPWDAIQKFADAIERDPRLWERVANHYLEPGDGEQYAWITVPAVLALAAPRVDLPIRRAMGRFLLECMRDAQQDSDYERELLAEACHRIGPDMLPEQWEFLPPLDPEATPGWFHLWGTLDIALETDDPDLRAGTIRVARQVLQRAIDGEVDIGQVATIGTLLGRLGDQEARPLLEKLIAMDAEIENNGWFGRMNRAELQHALSYLDGALPIRRLQHRDRTLQQWFTSAWQADADWSRERSVRPEPGLVPGFTDGVRRRPAEPKIGRNEPCPCGSGKKYKKCCLRA